MCSYKVVIASFEVWGMQGRCEDLIQRVSISFWILTKFCFFDKNSSIFFFWSSLIQSIRDILVLGHRQAFAWVDEWINMSLADVRVYECEMQRETNTKVGHAGDDEKKSSIDEGKKSSSSRNSSSSSKTSSPTSPKSPVSNKASKTWFSWE